jgi:hypothetical protein
VGDKLRRLKTKVSKVLLDLETNKGMEKTKALSLMCVDLEQTLLLGLDTFKQGGSNRELELVVLSGLEGVVGLGLGSGLDEVVKVLTTHLQVTATPLGEVTMAPRKGAEWRKQASFPWMSSSMSYTF